jgi:hypothetical protein
LATEWCGTIAPGRTYIGEHENDDHENNHKVQQIAKYLSQRHNKRAHFLVVKVSMASHFCQVETPVEQHESRPVPRTLLTTFMKPRILSHSKPKTNAFNPFRLNTEQRQKGLIQDPGSCSILTGSWYLLSAGIRFLKSVVDGREVVRRANNRTREIPLINLTRRLRVPRLSQAGL